MNKLTLNKNFLTAVFAAAVLLSACDKQIDLAPESITTEKDALTYQKGTERVLGGAYLSLLDASKGDAFEIGDLTTGIATSFTTDFATGALDSRNSIVGSFWSTNYKTINLANVIINKLPKYATFDLSIQNQLIGEAKFIRAFAYFNLLKHFGEGALEGKMDNMAVPLRLDAFDGYDGSQNLPRATNAEVYAQILKDLDEAIPVLMNKFSTNVDQHSRATKSAARALASRVALYSRNYAKSLSYSDAVLADVNFKLENRVDLVFPINGMGARDISFSDEILFGFPVSWNKDVTQYKEHGIYYAYGFIKPDTTVFMKTYAVTDMRRSKFFPDAANLKRNMKFSHPELLDNLIMLRLSEILLNKAEAEANLNGVTAAAVDALNKVYQRAFANDQKPGLYTTVDFASKQLLLDRILKERRWELAFEGQDRYDMIRTGRAPNASLPSSKYALPIPQREIDITDGLIKQNPGY
ncbi:RagB/SusD family nutrient uptake outer membrane protein [Solitalea sp. MAHUQ-68]|uniref:RagB/SusD family nutrient uptake outer membrane protein n=1 Tax=Solitalea agri TaxID=2953739 RepID=A0A9X2F1A4_9SPHI|nr:RagB/SusD family nutrient uptake outer membrane protein [Solitalea agri]MCO4292844.1 RagB/SusD family nutrient uptake outer membrane protein [Solitalea agri]